MSVVPEESVPEARAHGGVDEGVDARVEEGEQVEVEHGEEEVSFFEEVDLRPLRHQRHHEVRGPRHGECHHHHQHHLGDLQDHKKSPRL
ncbi:hypothetical protein JTE90_024380 [Oedothorax gibbosus]|uniref:Uncharacterized protein n=1 Tax=Oedothorax gibbosus TaxID=931172 RepID=A0AAV6TQV3_9ARAC|nr:hypothetical protein JTE90_024380 [Oedothorax gibbosus]